MICPEQMHGRSASVVIHNGEEVLAPAGSVLTKGADKVQDGPVPEADVCRNGGCSLWEGEAVHLPCRHGSQGEDTGLDSDFGQWGKTSDQFVLCHLCEIEVNFGEQTYSE